MDYRDTPEGYGSSHLPYQPVQRQQFVNEQRLPPAKRPTPSSSSKQPTKMPKARALAIARRMKQGIVVGSLLCFGTVGGVIIHQADLTLAQQSSQQTTVKASSSSSQGSMAASQSGSSTSAGTTSQPSTPAATSTATPSQGSTSSSQSGSSTQAGTTSQQQGGGYGFGSTSSGGSVSGSHTS